MASYTLSPVGGAGAQFFNNSGVPLTGGKLYTYQAGTTTPLTTWTTPSGLTANANPIILDSAGRPSSAGSIVEIWLSVAYSYKFVLKDSNDVTIATYDNVPGLPQPAVVNDASSISYEQAGSTVTAGSFVIGNSYQIASVGTTNFTAIGASANSTGVVFTATGVGSGTGTAYNSQTVQAKLQQVVSVKDFGAIGDGIANDTAAIQNAINYCTSDVNNPKTLFFPAGDYKITSGFNTITCKNFVIEGAGRGVEYFSPVAVNNQGVSRIVYDGVDNASLWLFDLSSARGVQIRQISILCNKKCNAIRATLSSNLLLEKLGLYEGYTGIYFIASCFSSVIDNVISYDHATNHIVFDATAHSTKITNCSFASDSGGATLPASVITLGDVGSMSTILISGCNFDVWRVPVFILAKDVNGLQIDGCYFEPRDATLTRFIQLGDQSASTKQCLGVNISGNKLYGVAVTSGIRIEVAYGVSITGNIFNSMVNAINCCDTGVSVNKQAVGVFVAGNRFAGAITSYVVVFDNTVVTNLVLLGNAVAGGVTEYNPSSTYVGKSLYFADGTFTPTIAFGGASTGVTYTTQTGRYKKIDDRIFFNIRIVLSSKGSATGNATIEGLPYTSTSALVQAVMPEFISGFTGLTGAPTSEISTSSTNISLGQTSSTGRALLTDTSFNNTATLNISGMYQLN